MNGHIALKPPCEDDSPTSNPSFNSVQLPNMTAATLEPLPRIVNPWRTMSISC